MPQATEDELVALAERCEHATGPDRELDCAILVAIDWRYNSAWRHLPRLTASLDAAMTLVPEGWWVQQLTQSHNRDATWVSLHSDTPAPVVQTSARADALALCAAALRARASKKEQQP
jgi:hypothetical protein